MSSGRTREERAHSIRIVLIASAASAIAAVVTSFFWRSGTPVAAAVTPVIVAVVSELLYHPTAKITDRMTGEGSALSRTPVTSEASALSRTQRSGKEPKPSEARLEQLGKTGTTEPLEAPTRPLPPEGGAAQPAEPTVYRSEGRRERGKVHLRFVIATTLIAFVAAAAVITLPELLGGESIGSSDRKTSFFGGGSGSDKGDKDEDADKPDEKDPDKPKDEPDPERPDTGGGSGSDKPKGGSTKPPAAAPAPDQQQGTQQTQTDTGSTSTTPR